MSKNETAKDIAAAFGVVGVFLAVVGGIIFVGFGLGLLAALWGAWWLVPVWAKVFVPLGVPAIGFWHLVALRIAGGALWPRTVQNTVKKEYRDESNEWVANTVGWIVGPPLAYLFVMWAMS